MFLVVRDSRKDSAVPLLLGTHVLYNCQTKCQQLCGDEMFLQNASLAAHWHLAFSCLPVWERQLERIRTG